MGCKSFFATLVAATALTAGAFASNAKTTPFRLQDNLIHLDAAVNGRPISAVLDSGTGAILIDKRVLGRLHIGLGKKLGLVPGGGTKPKAMYAIEIGGLDVGGVTLNQLPGIAMNTDNLANSAGFRIDALLGAPLFLTRPVRVDYPTRHVTFLPSGSAPTCEHPIEIDLVNDVPLAKVTLRPDPHSAPIKLHLYVDLGTRHFAAILGGHFLKTDAGKTLLARGTRTQIGTGTGGRILGVASKISLLDWGAQHFRNVTIALTDKVAAFNMGQADGSLGVPLWKDETITFDYPHHRLCLSH